ncbi:MAG: AAA family ATPase [Magnetococcales bacterium]|nr:AAA family ATPase [Magnetococcales bacterium]MBF0115907.1 AAA family ATPase [Magnetococcales bacterium]
MIKIRSFGCARYKAFRDPVTVDVRPLTLFYGKNSSGKSAILRLIRLLLSMFSHRTLHTPFPLKIDHLIYGHTFLDLVHGKSPNNSIDFSLTLEDTNLGEGDFSLTLQHVQDAMNDQPLVTNLRLNKDILEIKAENIEHVINLHKSNSAIVLGFIEGSIDKRIQGEWEFLIERHENRLQHLGPARAHAEHVYKLGQVDTVSFNGNGCINWLANNGQLLAEVGEWFTQNLDGWRLDLDTFGKAVECVLRKKGIAINLADAGQGMQQILPVVALQLSHRYHTSSIDSFLDLVEEPENSLHAAAQAALGDLFLETAKLGRGQVLVETHSENLLLRIRRRIAEGSADAKLVALYWVDESPEGCSTLKPIEIKEDGSVDWWPPGIYSEGYQEVMAINRANHKNGKKGSLR